MACFADDAVQFFVDNSLFVHHMPIEQQQALQLEALGRRLGAMRDAIAPLAVLAEAAGVGEIGRIEDVAGLMFPHQLYKSYSYRLFDELDFPALTEWLSRLTLVDLAAVKGRRFGAIDHWLDALDAETGLALLTSSGTTEALSLIPRGKRESELLRQRSLVEWRGPGAAAPVRAIGHRASMLWLSYADGRSGMLRSAAMLRENYTTPTTRFLPLLPMRASTDWQHYVGRVMAAERHGTPLPRLTPYVQARREEAAAAQASYDERIRTVLEIVRDELQDAPVHMAGGPLLLHRVATAGLRMGMAPGLPPGSRISTGGGTKGHAAPDGMIGAIKRFGGVDTIYEAYGMTEIGDAFGSCEQGRFHIWPWIVPLVFDEGSGALLPRRGRQAGRAGFFDLTAQTYWGGVVTADLVTISWDRCPCGRTTPQVVGPISRAASGTGADGPAGPSRAAMAVALEALNEGLG